MFYPPETKAVDTTEKERKLKWFGSRSHSEATPESGLNLWQGRDAAKGIYPKPPSAAIPEKPRFESLTPALAARGDRIPQ